MRGRSPWRERPRSYLPLSIFIMYKFDVQLPFSRCRRWRWMYPARSKSFSALCTVRGERCRSRAMVLRPASSSRRLHGHAGTYRRSAPGAAGRDRRRWSRRNSFLGIAAHIVIRFRYCGRAHLCHGFSFNVHQQFLLPRIIDLALGALWRLIWFFKLDAPFEI